MSDLQHEEYERVQAHIRERKAELKKKDIPEKFKVLITTIRNNRRHPLLREVVSEYPNQISFLFNEQPYLIEFRQSSPVSVPNGPRLCSGILSVQANSEVVLESLFEATEDDLGFDFHYKDTAIYKRGAWVDELLRLKLETDELRRSHRQAHFESDEHLANLRTKFAIPESPAPAPNVEPRAPKEPATGGALARLLGWASGKKSTDK